MALLSSRCVKHLKDVSHLGNRGDITSQGAKDCKLHASTSIQRCVSCTGAFVSKGPRRMKPRAERQDADSDCIPIKVSEIQVCKAIVIQLKCECLERRFEIYGSFCKPTEGGWRNAGSPDGATQMCGSMGSMCCDGEFVCVCESLSLSLPPRVSLAR